MGNALPAHDNLVYVRGWTRQQISTAIDTLRRKKVIYSLTREEFARYFGGRSREAITVFSDLDTDYDGKVDIFEVLCVVTIWSGINWDEQVNAFFELFDMMGKGFLKVDEVLLMITVLVQTVKKFVRIDSNITSTPAMKDMARQAMSQNEAKLSLEGFASWANGCEPLQKLRHFVQDRAPRCQAGMRTSRMRLDMGAFDAHAARLSARVALLQDVLPSFTDACFEYVSAWGRRKRWDFMMQNLRHLILKLQRLSESMHSLLGDLEASLHEDEVSGFTAVMVDPQKRFSQEQALLNLELLRRETLEDFREATNVLGRLVELTEPSDLEVTMEADHTGTGMVPTSSGPSLLVPPVVGDQLTTMKQVHGDMVSDMGENGFLHHQPRASDEQPRPLALANSTASAGENRDLFAASGTSSLQVEAGPLPLSVLDVPAGGIPRSKEPTMVAIGDFEPPPSHDTQMLKLCTGDEVTILGQDGRGWWYGRKQTGKEGWFPPSYVQMKAAHFSSVQ
jgi:Ca2+-binding EF-hand superfamily protein